MLGVEICTRSGLRFARDDSLDKTRDERVEFAGSPSSAGNAKKRNTRDRTKTHQLDLSGIEQDQCKAGQRDHTPNARARVKRPSVETNHDNSQTYQSDHEPEGMPMSDLISYYLLRASHLSCGICVIHLQCRTLCTSGTLDC